MNIGHNVDKCNLFTYTNAFTDFQLDPLRRETDLQPWGLSYHDPKPCPISPFLVS